MQTPKNKYELFFCFASPWAKMRWECRYLDPPVPLDECCGRHITHLPSPAHARTHPSTHWTFPEELHVGPSFLPALSTLLPMASPLPASLVLLGICIFFSSHLRPHHLSLPWQSSLLPLLLPPPTAPTPGRRQPVLRVWLETE